MLPIQMIFKLTYALAMMLRINTRKVVYDFLLF